jgi:DNA-directed RNA polymerase subunit K/omega
MVAEKGQLQLRYSPDNELNKLEPPLVSAIEELPHGVIESNSRGSRFSR